MEFSPIEYTDLSIQAYERIKEMILSGKLKPGEKLYQEKLASSLGISRMPLHKAFQMLEDEFFVESRPRRGFFVRQTDIREIIEAFECREGLEGIAARRAAKNLSPDQINDLKGLVQPFIHQENIDMIVYQRNDQAFHEMIIQASHNSVLQKLNNIGNVLIRTFPKGIILPVRDSIQDHLLIIDAIEQRNPDLAEKLIRNHSKKARYILEKQLIKTIEE
jgi:GntR family transcriptional regulator, vanillate catabolism transcriptional regulator